ncbi:MAG: class I SAM-dependent methyltransferase [Promethearchaeota archaeon]
MYKNILSYLKTINWTKRMELEIPLLTDFLSSIGSNTSKNKITVLDLGCGPGKHLQKLCQIFPDYHFSGVDLSQGMIDYAKDQARQHNYNISYYANDFLADIELNPATFDMIYSLGNSFALIWGNIPASPKQLIAKVSHHLKPGGILFFQILNSDNPRNGYWKSKITKISETQEVFTLKRFEPDLSTKRMSVEFVSFTRNLTENSFTHDVKTSSWPLITTDEITTILHKHGFTEVQFWENYRKTPLNPSTGESRLCFARKDPKGIL